MITVLVISAILVSLFLWGAWGISADEKEGKASKARLSKTILMLIITIAIGTFYVKTYQVANVKQVIKIKGVKCSMDSANHIADTLQYVVLRNAFTKEGTKYASIHKLTGEKLIEEQEEEYGAEGQDGGLGFSLNLQFQNDLYPIRQISAFSAYNIDPYLFQFKDHIYYYEFLSNEIPSLIPFSNRAIEKDYGFLDDNPQSTMHNRVIYGTASDSIIRRPADKDIIDFIGESSIRVTGQVASTDIDGFYKWALSQDPSTWKPLLAGINLQWNQLTGMNIFTAADLTQCSYDIIYDFDCPVKEFYITFDIPTSLSQLPYGIRPLDSYSYVIDDPEYVSKMQKGSLLLHVNFPTMNNLQLIRSLVLTSILTVFFSCFCINGYYLFRKHEDYVPQGKIWKKIYKVIIYSIISLIIAITILMWTNTSIQIPNNNYMDRTWTNY